MPYEVRLNALYLKSLESRRLYQIVYMVTMIYTQMVSTLNIVDNFITEGHYY